MPLLTQYFLPNHPGLGDNIRGAILLKKLADRYNYTYQPNFRCGVIRDFVDLKNTSDSVTLPTDLETFYVHQLGTNLGIHLICRLLETGADVNIVSNIGHISTATHPLILDQDSKLFVKNLLIPTSELAEKINRFAVDNSIHNKTIYHIRCLDTITETSDNFIKFISSKVKGLNNNLLFSNSENLKSKLCSNSSAIVATTEASHFGNLGSKSSIEANMMEYFLLGMVKNIVTYSDYPWTSNFISSKAAAHDIPVKSNYIVSNSDATWSISNSHANIIRTIKEHQIFI